MPFTEARNRRNNYTYPAVGLQGSCTNLAVIKFNSTMAMDNYIQKLLLSEIPEEKILGYLSVVFWGFYSGQDDRIRQEWALGKVALAWKGKDRMVKGKSQRIRGVLDFGVDFIAGRIGEAIRFINANEFSEALKVLNKLPQLGMAFSSKVCAFIDPSKCGVIDSVIAEKHPEFGFRTNEGIILNRKENRQKYNGYCLYLQQTAETINNSKIPFLWTDRDGSQYKWRALDVERAMY